MKSILLFLSLAGALCISPQCLAQSAFEPAGKTDAAGRAPKKKDPKAPPRDFKKRFKKLVVVGPFLKSRGASLSLNQWKSVTRVDELYSTRWNDVSRQLQEVLTDEQRARRQNTMDANKANGIVGRAAEEALKDAISYSVEQQVKIAELRRFRDQARKDAARLVFRLLTRDQLNTARLPKWFQKSVVPEFLGDITFTEFQWQAAQAVEERFRHVDRQVEIARNQVLSAEQKARGDAAAATAEQDGVEKKEVQRRRVAAQNRTDLQTQTLEDLDGFRASLKRRAFARLSPLLTLSQWQQLSDFPKLGPHSYLHGRVFTLPSLNKIGMRLSAEQVVAASRSEEWFAVFTNEIERQRTLSSVAENATNEQASPVDAATSNLSLEALDRINSRCSARAKAELAEFLTEEQTVIAGIRNPIRLGHTDSQFPSLVDSWIGELPLAASQRIRIDQLEKDRILILTELERQRTAVSNTLRNAQGTSETGPLETGPLETGPLETGPLETNRDAEILAEASPSEDGAPLAKQENTSNESQSFLSEIDVFRQAAETRFLRELQAILTPAQLGTLPELVERVQEIPAAVERSENPSGVNIVAKYLDVSVLPEIQKERVAAVNEQFQSQYLNLQQIASDIVKDFPDESSSGIGGAADTSSIALLESAAEQKNLTSEQMFQLLVFQQAEGEFEDAVVDALRSILSPDEWKLLKNTPEANE